MTPRPIEHIDVTGSPLSGITVPRVVVLILNYIEWADTVACVRSLQSCTYKNFDIVLVDNASPNDSEIQLREQFPELVLFQTGSNLGYTGGVNYGIKKVLQKSPEYILVLNPDTTVEKNFLEHLVVAMRENPNVAIAGGTIYHSDDKSKIWYAGGWIIPLKGIAYHYTSLKSNLGSRSEKSRHVTFVTGCAMFLRTSALGTIGLLDERFYLYLDDIEYCARAQKLGFDLLYVPDAKIFHNIVWQDKAIHKLYYSVRNRFLLIRTAFSGVQQWIAIIYFSFTIALKMIGWLFGNTKYYEASRMGLADYFAGRFGPGRDLTALLNKTDRK